MELYYFIEKGGVKLGPYKVPELASKHISGSDQVWRSDMNSWKKAQDFEELKNILIVLPPPTPKEQKIKEFDQQFTRKALPGLFAAFIIISFMFSIPSFIIAQTSWENWEKVTGKTNPISASSVTDNIILTPQHLTARYKTYSPFIDNERASAEGQLFLTRPFYAFFSTLYLNSDEQGNPGRLFLNLLFSSSVLGGLIMIIIGILIYAERRINLEYEFKTHS